MRAIVQRVARAEVSAGGRTLGKIGRGFVILLGVGRGDTEADADYLLDRIIASRRGLSAIRQRLVRNQG